MVKYDQVYSQKQDQMDVKFDSFFLGKPSIKIIAYNERFAYSPLPKVVLIIIE